MGLWIWQPPKIKWGKAGSGDRHVGLSGDTTAPAIDSVTTSK